MEAATVDTGDPIVPVLSPPAGDVLYEVVDDQIRELPPIGAYDCRIAGLIDQAIGPFAQTNQLGRVQPEMLFQLRSTPRRLRRPDVSFVSYRRWARNRPVPRTDAWEVVPNLAVEVVSPTDIAAELLAKVREYFQAGVEQVWVVYPTEQLIYVYESVRSIRVRTRTDELVGEPVLPGFRMPLATLFEEEADGH